MPGHGERTSHTFSPSFSGTFTLGQNLNTRRFRETDVNGQNLVAATPFNLQNTRFRPGPGLT